MREDVDPHGDVDAHGGKDPHEDVTPHAGSEADGMWASVEALWAWLDRSNTRPPEQELLLRMLKLSEEVGEVAQAVIGTLGQNPRKGVTHDWDDVRAELCDVR
ncbi:MazG-like family protein [Streptomyces sp. UH6]|uniref:MazG-like family protein n=1 Tax=Streptomyces sp. UH6 TaxID=2748379 RepID=UPI0035BC16B6